MCCYKQTCFRSSAVGSVEIASDQYSEGLGVKHQLVQSSTAETANEARCASFSNMVDIRFTFVLSRVSTPCEMITAILLELK